MFLECVNATVFIARRPSYQTLYSASFSSSRPKTSMFHLRTASKSATRARNTTNSPRFEGNRHSVANRILPPNLAYSLEILVGEDKVLKVDLDLISSANWWCPSTRKNSYLDAARCNRLWYNGHACGILVFVFVFR